MRRRAANRLGWASGLLAAAAVAGACAYGVVMQFPSWGLMGQELWTLAWVGFPLTGAVIAGRSADTRIGWMLIGTGFAIAVGRTGAVYVNATFAGEVTPDVLVAGVMATFELIGFATLAAALLHFPTDRLPSRRWRIPLAVLGLCSFLFVASAPFVGVIQIGEAREVANPYAVPALGWLQMSAPVIVVGMMVVLADLVRRAIRSRGVARQQLKWLAYPAAAYLVVIVTVVALDILGVEWDGGAPMVIVAWVVCFNGFAAAIGTAVLRYRLYDIDRVASRTVTYVGVTVVLVVTYAAAVVLFGRIVHAIGGGSGGDLVVAASTLVVAALFGPLRSRVQWTVDRHFNRASYDAADTVESFSHRLRDELDPDAIAGHLHGAAATAMQPRLAGVWLLQR